MARWRQGRSWQARAAPALLAAVLLGLPARAETELTLATGAADGADHKVGAALCRLYNEARANHMPACTATPSAGAVANVDALRNATRRLALVQADVVEAAARSRPPTGLRVVMALHVDLFTVLARRDAGVAAFTDLKGRRVGVARRSSGGRVTLGKVMQHYGWIEQQAFARVVELAPAERADALCNGTVDAVIDVAGHPDPSFAAAARRCSTRLVGVGGRSMERMMSRYVAYRPSAIPAGLYAGTATATPTIGMRVLLMAPASLDRRVAGRLVEAAVKGVAVLREAHPSLAGIEPRDMVPGEGAVEIHPGARDAFRAADLGR